MLSTHRFILLYFFKEIISCFIYMFRSKFLAYAFLNHIFCGYIFSIKPRIFNIAIDFFYSDIFSSSFLQLQEKTERSNAFSKMYDILDFSNFLYLTQITQYNFFLLLVTENILVLFHHSFQYSPAENKFIESSKLLSFKIKSINSIQKYPHIELCACIL